MKLSQALERRRLTTEDIRRASWPAGVVCMIDSMGVRRAALEVDGETTILGAGLSAENLGAVDWEIVKRGTQERVHDDRVQVLEQALEDARSIMGTLASAYGLAERALTGEGAFLLHTVAAQYVNMDTYRSTKEWLTKYGEKVE